MNLKPLIKEGKFKSLIQLIELSKNSYPSNPFETFKKLIENNSICELSVILESLEVIINKKMIQGKNNKEVVEKFIEEYERIERLYDFNYDEYLQEVERTGIDLN